MDIVLDPENRDAGIKGDRTIEDKRKRENIEISTCLGVQVLAPHHPLPLLRLVLHRVRGNLNQSG